MDDYAINLRKNEFPVVVYEEQLDRLFKAEAEWIAAQAQFYRLSRPNNTEKIVSYILNSGYSRALELVGSHNDLKVA